MAKKKKKLTRARKRRAARRRVVRRSLLVLFTLILLALIAVFGAATVLAIGPSPTLSDRLVMSCQESSAAKFVGHIYFSDEEFNAIIERNSVKMDDTPVDTSLVQIAFRSDVPTVEQGDETEEKDIEIVPITNKTYNGFMMIVKDPSRVSVGVSTGLGSQAGMQLAKIAEKYGAIGAINAGGFADANGMGDGGTPIGPVISQGKVVWSRGGGENKLVIGLTRDNILTFGVMGASTAAEKGIRDAVTFGPVLVKNGKPADVSGAGSGYNPRTAIGQRADGAILLLVVNGRKVNSLGATYSDLINIFLDFGAVNAANLDGGTSSFMYYDGQLINDKAALYGTRKLPTAWIVK